MDGATALGWRGWLHGRSTRWYGPSPLTTSLSWLGEERLAVGNLPTAATLRQLAGDGVTHVVNCRARAQTWLSQDLAVERLVFGRARVVHAPMWDLGRPQPAVLWSSAALFAAEALSADPDARVLIHCQQGRRRSVLVAYAVLRLRGWSPGDAADLILRHRQEAVLVPTYRASVEAWLVDRG
jgi:protein-tyrosine phosphatase